MKSDRSKSDRELNGARHRVTVKDLALVAAVATAIFLAFAGLMYLGLFLYRDVFTKMLAMVLPPLATYVSWDIERKRRRRLGQLPPERLTTTETCITVVCLIAYSVVTYFFVQHAEILFLAIASLYALSYGWWLKRRRAESHPPISK